MTMRPRHLFLAPLLVLLVTGCLGDDGRGPSLTPTATSGGPTSSSSMSTAPPIPGPPVVDLLLGFAFEDCVGVSLQQTVSIVEVQALLPAGFTARPGEVEGTGTVVVDFYACGNLTASSARVPSTHFGHLYTPIEPPADRVPGTPEADVHEYVFRVLAGEDVLANLWPAAGYDTRSGAAAVLVGPPGSSVPLDVGLRTAEATIGADYQAMATGTTTRAAAVTGTFARYTALNDGSVLVWTGTYDFGGAYGGSGTAQVPDDDLFDRFEVADQLAGLATLSQGGGMAGMDLRRVFTPP